MLTEHFSVVLDHPTFPFGGTRTFNEWIVDFMAPDVPFFQHRSFGPIHLGFWNDINATTCLKHQAALSVAYGAGLRVAEVAALKVADIDSERMLIRVERGKGGRYRNAMLPAESADLAA
jgi:hypothetical protein